MARGVYNYHRCAVDLRELVTNAAAERLRASRDFTQVKLYDGRYTFSTDASRNSRKLAATVLIKAEVAISMANLETGATVWANEVSEASEVGTVEQRDVPAVVAEMNATIERAI